MSFYNLPKDERTKLVSKIGTDIFSGIATSNSSLIKKYFSEDDTYIRKAAYQSIGKIFFSDISLRPAIIILLEALYKDDDEKIRQTVINAAGEIGIKYFEDVERFFDTGLFDKHHSVRNAVIGSVKKMSEKNPKPVLQWANKFLHHEEIEIRREVCHGIELRGRTHPQDILPLLKELQYDKTARVRNTLIHVIGQISYKKGCLEKVIANLASWENKGLVKKALAEIIDVHERYKNFAVLTREEAIRYIEMNSPL